MPIDTDLEPAELEQRVLDAIELIRPALQSDGGDIVFARARRRRRGPREPGRCLRHLPDLDADAQGRRRAHHHGPRAGRHRRRRRLPRRVTAAPIRRPDSLGRDAAGRAGDGDRAALGPAPHDRRDPAATPPRDALAVAAALAAVGHAAVVGITGAPGAGKSTLTDGLVAQLRDARRARRGARHRPHAARSPAARSSATACACSDHDTDDGVFVRSMATRGELGGLSRADAARGRACSPPPGYAWILVETVGVGQVEVAVAGAADTTVVVVTPGWGDGVQASKAGLLEIGDVFVVNKADRGGVGRHRPRPPGRCSMLAGARATWSPPIVETVATDGRGVDELRRRGRARIGRICEASGELAERARTARIGTNCARLVLEWVAKQADDICSGPRFDSVVRRVADGIVDPYTAATELVGDRRAPTEEEHERGIERVGVVGRRAHGVRDRRGLRPGRRRRRSCAKPTPSSRPLGARAHRGRRSTARCARASSTTAAVTPSLGRVRVHHRPRRPRRPPARGRGDHRVRSTRSSTCSRNLDKILDDDDAIIASNTSSIPIMKLAMATRPSRARASGCTSSTRCRCSTSSSSSRRSSRATTPPTASRSSAPNGSASGSSARRTAPGSS